MKTVDIVVLILSSNVLLFIVQYFINLNKNKEEVKNIVTQYYSRVFDDMNEEIDRLKSENKDLLDRVCALQGRLDELATNEATYQQDLKRCREERASLLKKIETYLKKIKILESALFRSARRLYSNDIHRGQYWYGCSKR